MMDLDQASLSARLDAQDQLLRALSQTQSDHTARLTRVEDRLTRVEDRLTRVEDRLTRVESSVGRIEIGVRTVLGLLQGEN
jgi:hypothetical protein